MKIVAIIFAILAMLVLVLFLLHDIISSIDYLRGKKCKGEIIEKLGEEEVAYYGRHRRPEVFGKYLVRYTDEREITIEETLLRKEVNLTKGIHIDVRYLEKDGETHLVTDAYMRRLGEFLIALILGIALAIFAYNYTR